MQRAQLEPVQKQVLKVAVLSEPYFPLQKLVIRFSQTILQQMNIDEKFQDSSQLIGIVCKMDKSYRSHAHYGTVCEILGQE
jgi:hypothetical protein